MRFRQRVQVRAQSGQALVEAAIVLPVILIVVFGIINFAIVWNHWESLTDAVRAGARAAATCRFAGNSTAPAFAAYEAAAGDLPSHPAPTIGACGASGSPIQVIGTYPYSINVMGVVVKSGDLTSATTETTE
jgi:Flp pilus assembly protein TadG